MKTTGRLHLEGITCFLPRPRAADPLYSRGGAGFSGGAQALTPWTFTLRW